MTIAIMGAMPEEITPLLEIIGEHETISYAANKYYKGKFANHDVVVAYSKIGKVNAALTASTLIEKFGAQKLLFSGVAGAVSAELKVGDLIIASQLCQHDLDITAFGHPHGYVPEGKQFVQADKSLNALAKKVAQSIDLKLKEGIIATGDQFIANVEKKNWIETTFKADALEMEGASVAVVCDALDVPFFVLRAISDAADIDASFSFDEFLESSAQISADFIMKMVKEIS